MNELSYIFEMSIFYMGGFLITLFVLQRLIRILNPRFRLPIKYIFSIALLGGIISVLKSNVQIIIPIIIGVIALYVLWKFIKRYLNNKRR